MLRFALHSLLALLVAVAPMASALCALCVCCEADAAEAEEPALPSCCAPPAGAATLAEDECCSERDHGFDATVERSDADAQRVLAEAEGPTRRPLASRGPTLSRAVDLGSGVSRSVVDAPARAAPRFLIHCVWRV